MENNLPLHIKNFNAKVKAMNQSNAKMLTLNVEEARSLHAEIYDLMATISSLSKQSVKELTGTITGTINMDGGGFK